MLILFQGLLRIHVAEARDLIKQDITLLGGKSDPFVIVTIGAQQFRTQTIHDNLNPVWDYWCEVIDYMLIANQLNIYSNSLFYFW